MELLEEKHKRTKNHKLEKVLVAVHNGGQSCDMEKSGELSKKYGCKVSEDRSNALGWT